MRKPDSFWILLIFAGLLLFYFLSESILRQATVARINPDAVNVDAMLSDLPPALQQKIQDRITHTQLLTNLRKAVTPDEILNALLALALFEKDPLEKEKLYTQIFKDYAKKPAAYPAYIFFMFNKEEHLNRVTVADFHAYQKTLPVAELYYSWSAAYNKLREFCGEENHKLKFEFLLPLNAYKQLPFVEYYPLYEELRTSALECGKPEIAQNASRLLEQVSFQRSFSEYMMQMEEEYHYRTNLQKKKAGQ